VSWEIKVEMGETCSGKVDFAFVGLASLPRQGYCV